MAGSYQIRNAALVLEAVEQLRLLGYELSGEQVLEAMEETVWRGRFTPIRKEPVMILDGAHNPAAAKVLRESLELYFQGKKLYYIMGVFADKDYNKMIEITAPLAERIFTVETPDNPRALPAQKLKEAVEKINPRVQAEASILEAVKEALVLAKPEDVIVAFGSLSYLSEVDKAVKALG